MTSEAEQSSAKIQNSFESQPESALPQPSPSAIPRNAENTQVPLLYSGMLHRQESCTPHNGSTTTVKRFKICTVTSGMYQSKKKGSKKEKKEQERKHSWHSISAEDFFYITISKNKSFRMGEIVSVAGDQAINLAWKS